VLSHVPIKSVQIGPNDNNPHDDSRKCAPNIGGGRALQPARRSIAPTTRRNVARIRFLIPSANRTGINVFRCGSFDNTMHHENPSAVGGLTWSSLVADEALKDERLRHATSRGERRGALLLAGSAVYALAFSAARDREHITSLAEPSPACCSDRSASIFLILSAAHRAFRCHSLSLHLERLDTAIDQGVTSLTCYFI